MPVAFLAHSPFRNVLVPGIILFCVLGLVPIGLIFALLSKPDWNLAERANFFNGMHWSWTGPAHPTLSVPISVRNELRAIVLYGPHRRGDDLDPDEVSVLASLAGSASAALDHAEAVRLRKESTRPSKDAELILIELAKLRAALGK